MSLHPVARLLPVVCLALAPGLAPPETAAAPVPTHLMPKDPPLAFPTRVGTKWVYDVGRGLEDALEISRVEDKDGATLVTTEFTNGGKRTPHMVVSVSEAGVFLVSESGVAYDTPWCFLKLPHREGRTWDTEVRQGGSDVLTGAMTAGPWERVKVPAGEFTAARVEWETGPPRGRRKFATYWYAHGVELVRLGENRVLKSFTPGKD